MHAPLPSASRLVLSGDGAIEGYASLFGAVDSARDMMMPGAFAQTLASRGLRRVRMLFQHDPAEVIGVWDELREDIRGLYARGRLIADVQRGRELLALLRSGAIDGLSIGYRTVRGHIDPRTRVRKLYQVDLWEISLVTFPLLEGARVEAIKSPLAIKPSPQRRAAEAAWRSASGGVDVSPPLAMRRMPSPPAAIVDRSARKAALQRFRPLVRV